MLTVDVLTIRTLRAVTVAVVQVCCAEVGGCEGGAGGKN